MVTSCDSPNSYAGAAIERHASSCIVIFWERAEQIISRLGTSLERFTQFFPEGFIVTGGIHHTQRGIG